MDQRARLWLGRAGTRKYRVDERTPASAAKSPYGPDGKLPEAVRPPSSISRGELPGGGGDPAPLSRRRPGVLFSPLFGSAPAGVPGAAPSRDARGCAL